MEKETEIKGKERERSGIQRRDERGRKVKGRKGKKYCNVRGWKSKVRERKKIIDRNT